MDIAFRAPKVEHYNEEQAVAIWTEDVDRAEEERLITCIRTAKYLEGLRRYYNRNIKGHSFAVDDLVLRRKQKTEGMHKLSSPEKGLTWSKRLPDQVITGYLTWMESISSIRGTSSTSYVSILETLQICTLHSIMNEVLVTIICLHYISITVLVSICGRQL